MAGFLVEAVGVEAFALLTPRKLLNVRSRQVLFLHPLRGRMYEICTVAFLKFAQLRLL
jgi:hypothetical protein